MFGFALKVWNALDAAIVLAGGCVQLDAHPHARLKVGGAQETDDATGVVRADQHRLSHYDPIGKIGIFAVI